MKRLKENLHKKVTKTLFRPKMALFISQKQPKITVQSEVKPNLKKTKQPFGYL